MQLRFNKVNLLVRVLGALVGVSGLVVICGAASMSYHMLRDRPQWVAAVLGVVFSLLMLALGVYAVSVFVRACRPLTASIIRQICGLLTVLLWAQLGAWFRLVPQSIHRLPEDAWRSIAFFAALVIAAVAYVVASRWLIARSTVADKTRPPVSKNLIGLVCFFLFLDTSMVLHELAPKTPESQHVPEEPWLWIGFLGPLVLAVVVYHLVVHYAYSLPGLPYIGPRLHAARQARQAALHQKRIRLFQCPVCEYDLRQSLADGREVCPECGFELASTEFPDMPVEEARPPATT